MPKAQGHTVGLDGADFHKSALQLTSLWLIQGIPGTLLVDHSPFSPLHLLPCLLLLSSPACERAEFNSDPSSKEGPLSYTLYRGSASPHSCPGLSTPPPAVEERRERKRNPSGASGAQPLRSPGVWFQLGGQIPGSQASAGEVGVGVGGAQSKAQNEEAPGIWPQEEAPVGQGIGLRGLLGKKPGLCGGLSPSSQFPTYSVLSE